MIKKTALFCFMLKLISAVPVPNVNGIVNAAGDAAQNAGRAAAINAGNAVDDAAAGLLMLRIGDNSNAAAGNAGNAAHAGNAAAGDTGQIPGQVAQAPRQPTDRDALFREQLGLPHNHHSDFPKPIFDYGFPFPDLRGKTFIGSQSFTVGGPYGTTREKILEAFEEAQEEAREHGQVVFPSEKMLGGDTQKVTFRYYRPKTERELEQTRLIWESISRPSNRPGPNAGSH